MKFSIEAKLDMPADTYFAERDSAAFRSLLMKALKLGKMEFADVWKDEHGVYFVKLTTQPELGSWVPKSLRRYMEGPNGIEYTDVLTYDPAKLKAPGPFELRATTTPSFFSDKVDIHTKLTIFPEGPSSCRQVLEGEVVVRLMGMGRMVENVIVDSLKNTYAVLPQVVQRWVAVREELMKQPGGAKSVTAGQPLPLMAAMLGKPVSPERVSLQEPMSVSPVVQNGDYKAKRPAPLDIPAVPATPSSALRSLQQPYEESPGTALLYTATSAKRKWENVASDVEMQSQPSGKLQDMFGASFRTAASHAPNTPWGDAMPAWEHDSDMPTDMDAESAAMLSRSTSVSMETAPSASTSRSNSVRQPVLRQTSVGGASASIRPNFRQVSLCLQDLQNSKDAHNEAGGDEFFDAQGDVYCTCGECAECVQDVQTAQAILADRQRVLTEMPERDSTECCELTLPSPGGLQPTAPQYGTSEQPMQSNFLHKLKRPFMRQQGYTLLESVDSGHLLAERTESAAVPAANGSHQLDLSSVDFASMPPLMPGQEGPTGPPAGPPRGHHRRHSSMTHKVYHGASAKLQPGRWSAFNDNYAHWNQVWDDLHVAEAPVPNTAARLLHMLALLHSWGVVKFVDPLTGKSIRSSEALGRSHRTAGANVQPSEEALRVRVRGRWFLRCFGCYMDHDELMAVEAERRQREMEHNKKSKLDQQKQSISDQQKQRLLLGSSAVESR